MAIIFNYRATYDQPRWIIIWQSKFQVCPRSSSNALGNCIKVPCNWFTTEMVPQEKASNLEIKNSKKGETIITPLS